MTTTDRFDKGLLWLTLCGLLLLTACGGGGSDNDAETQQRYTIELTNLTANQPLSPAALVFHAPGNDLWGSGDSVSTEFEVLAESGDPQPFLDEAANLTSTIQTLAGSGVIPPGSSETFSVTLTGSERLSVTLATMLVNTNDAFAGASGADMPSLAVGGTRIWYLPAYDAGTEGNSETAASVPGPAAGGEGFNTARDDGDRVAIHPGVISAQDGLSASALNGSHRWDNPVIKVAFTRTE